MSRLPPGLSRVAAAAIALALAGIACGTPYRLPPAWVPRGPTTERWPDAGAVALEDVTLLRFELARLREGHGEQLVAVEDRRLRLKVLREEGLAEAHVSLPIDGFSTVTRVVARTVAKDGAVRNMSVHAPTALARAPLCERAPELKTLDFTVPGAEVGGLIEVRYERVHIDPLMVPVHVFATHLPTARAEYAVLVPERARLDYRFGRGDQLVDTAPVHSERNAEGERLVFIEQDVPPAFDEPAMAHPSRNAPWLAIALREAPDVRGHRRRPRQVPDLKALRDWGDVAAILRPQMAAPGADALAQGGLRAQLAAYRQHVHALCLPGLGVREGRDVDQLWAGSPASSRDAAALLAGLFRAAGATAFPALAVTHGGPPAFDDFPSLTSFTQAVVALEVGPELLADQGCGRPPLEAGPLCGLSPGDMLFVDPLCRRCPLGTRPPALAEGRAMIIAPDRHGWQRIGLDPPQRNLTAWSGAWQMDALGALAGRVEARVRGQAALVLRDRWAERPPAAAWRAALATVLFGAGPTDRTRGEQAGGLDDLDAPLHLFAEAQITAARRAVERFVVTPRQLAGDPVPQAWRGGARRTTALLVPSWHESTLALELPPGFRATLPPPLRLVDAHGEYAAGFSQHGQSVRFSRRLVFKSGHVDPTAWNDFVDFVAAIDTYEGRPLPIFARDS